MNILKSIAMPFLWIASKVEVVDNWLFTDEERAPMGFIYLFFINILVSTAICLFILSMIGVL